jgi:hypothetical protein
MSWQCQNNDAVQTQHSVRVVLRIICTLQFRLHFQDLDYTLQNGRMTVIYWLKGFGRKWQLCEDTEETREKKKKKTGMDGLRPRFEPIT